MSAASRPAEQDSWHQSGAADRGRGRRVIFVVVLASQRLADGFHAILARRGTRLAAAIAGKQPAGIAALLRRMMPGRRAAGA